MIQFIEGDTLEVLRGLSACSIQCCVTSPPYWGLRDYGVSGQLGLEPTPEAYVARMVEVFREVRRVLRDDGVLFLNMGDSYATGTQANRNATTTNGSKVPASWSNRNQSIRCGTPGGLKTKDLCGIPWRLAFALQADGWYLRSDIIWHKPNPMPESVRDRPTKAHEYVFLMSKSQRYFWDADAVREETTDPEYRTQGKIRPSIDPLYVQTGNDGSGRYRCGLHHQEGPRTTRNIRSVWSADDPLVSLRLDLTPEKKAYVVGELLKRGLL